MKVQKFLYVSALSLLILLFFLPCGIRRFGLSERTGTVEELETISFISAFFVGYGPVYFISALLALTAAAFAAATPSPRRPLVSGLLLLCAAGLLVYMAVTGRKEFTPLTWIILGGETLGAVWPVLGFRRNDA